MASSTTPDASGWEPMTWFTSVLKDWISFTSLIEYLCFVVWWFICVPLTLGLLFFFILYITMCFVALYLRIYKYMNNAPEDKMSKLWDKPRHILSYMASKLGRITHGYEIIGMENIPEGPAIIVFYHGTLCYDFVFFASDLILQKGRVCHSVIENRVYDLPGLKPYFQLFGCIPGNRTTSVEILKNNQLLGVTPGGMREALFSDNCYKLMWANRTGFAQVALEAKVPIVPMFTKNIREVNRTIGNSRFTRWLFEKTRWYILPISGYFPVKLCTYVGEPIPYDPNITAQELAEKAKIAVENLRDKYQRIPGSILSAFLERFGKHHKED